MELRLSRFCHFVDGNQNFVAAYNALTLGVVIVDKKVAAVLRSENQDGNLEKALREVCGDDAIEIVSALKKHKLLIPIAKRIDESDYLELQKQLSIKRIGILYLLVTDACNLACKYCFVEGSFPEDYCTSLMSRETAKVGIDLFIKALSNSHGVTEPQIIFYGGEPFLNPDVIEYALSYIGQCKRSGDLSQETAITINTNGTRIDQSMLSFLKKAENLSIAISVDGPRDIHDLCRPYHRGTGSFDDVMRGYNLLKENGIEAGLCCTISRHNVGTLKNIAQWFVEDLGVSSLGFNLIIESPTACNARGSLEDYAKEASQKLIDCFLYFRDSGVYEDRIMRKVNAFVDGTVYFYDCGGCGQQLVVAPDGMVGVCQGYCGTKKNYLPMNELSDPLVHPLWEEWRRRSPLAMPVCKECIALSVCGGGCPYSADIRTGSIWGLDEIFCTHARATVEFLLKDLLNNACS